MANEMGSEDLESKRNEPEEVYRLISYPGAQLPLEFRSLIIGPFLNSLRYGNDLFKLIDRDAYFIKYARYIETLLQRPQVVIKMAILVDDTVLGWSMIEGNCLHYLWVKKEVRRQGIGKSLLPKNLDTISHVTNKGLGMWSKFKEVKFDPFI